MKAFFRLQDHRRAYKSSDIRLSDVVAVSETLSAAGEWYVNVTLRQGTEHQMGTSDLRQLGKWRDELMYALEQDAKPAQMAATANLDPLCSATLKAQGLPYPRTCPVHGLGPCPTIRAEEATGD